MFNWATSSHEPATRTIAGRFVFFVCADHRFSPETRTDQLIRPVKCNVIDNFAALIIIFERQLSVEKTNYKLIITRTQAFARASCNGEISWWAEWRGWLLFNWKVVKLNLCIFFCLGLWGFGDVTMIIDWSTENACIAADNNHLLWIRHMLRSTSLAVHNGLRYQRSAVTHNCHWLLWRFCDK